jgi:hypothetical protein
MAPKVLSTNQLTTDTAVDSAIAHLPPIDDSVLVVVRNLQAQITALTARVTLLGG